MQPYFPYSYREDPSVPHFADDQPIIVFDGYCALCSGWVNFVMQHDNAKTYRLLSAQSALGQAIYAHYGMDTEDFQSNILMANGSIWLKSEGSIRMAEGLGFPWRIAGVARLLPLAWRDRLYSFVARHRFAWFGRRSACYLPAAEHHDRFLG